MDFYWSDPERQRWDNLLTTAEVLETGDFAHREQVVHWVRSFPFSFLSDRSYVIGRKQYQIGDTLYGITKVVKYPFDSGRTVRTDNYWSMWSCAPCACPFGSGAHFTNSTCNSGLCNMTACATEAHGHAHRRPLARLCPA
jgi:hypothetical protein